MPLCPPPKTEKVALTAVASATQALAWQNPTGVDILVTRLVIDVTTQSNGVCTVDAGDTSTSAATSSDTLIDGQSVAATGTFDNIENQGTNGKATVKIPAGKWLTITTSAAATGLVANAYITYIPA